MQYPKVLEVASANHGVLTRGQLLEFISVRTVERWLANDILFRIAPGVYSFERELSWRSRIHACCLSAPELMVAYRAAARLWGIAPIGVYEVELLGPAPVRRRIPHAKLYESGCLPSGFMTVVDGTPVTTVSRTISDLGTVWGPDLLFRTITKALDARLCSISEIRRTHDALRSKGRRRSRFLDALLEDHRFDDPKNQSFLERQALDLIRRSGLPKPVSQHAIPFETFTLHPDFCYPDMRLAIELDGFEAHGNRVAFHDDRERDALLAAEGWHVLRFSSQTLRLLPSVLSAYFRQRSAG